MRLSTAIRRPYVSSPERFLPSFQEILAACTKAGFEVLDFNFAHYTRWVTPIHEANFEDYWKLLRDEADKMSVVWSQGHAHFVNWEIEDLNDWPHHDELVRRSIIGAGIMGVKTLVVHPKTMPDSAWYSRKASLALNVESFKKYLDWAAPYGVTLAVENLSEKRIGRRFGSGPEELLELVEAVDDPALGICWDTGHAHISGINQAEALQEIGGHLKALHINDNHGEQDEHLAPMKGTIEWAPIIKTLRKIDYPGDFTYEVVCKGHADFPRLYELFVEGLYELGHHLLALGETSEDSMKKNFEGALQ